MKKIAKVESGFSVVELLLVLILLFVIGGVGYMVYHNNHKTNTSSSSLISDKKNSSSSLQASTITEGPTNGLKTYTNNSVGFSFAFPDTSINPNSCSQTDSYDGNGANDNVLGPNTYRTSEGQVTNTVISNGTNYYVVPTYTYILTGGKTTTIGGQSGYDVFNGCQKVNDTLGLINEQTADDSQVNGATSIDFSVFSMKAQVVEQGTPLNEAVETILGDNTLKVSKLTPGKINGSEKLSFTCSQQTCGNIGGNYSLLFYPSKNLLVFWSLGQSCNLFANQSSNSACYDNSVVNSFKLTN